MFLECGSFKVAVEHPRDRKRGVESQKFDIATEARLFLD
jgi:hypothetical protein